MVMATYIYGTYGHIWLWPHIVVVVIATYGYARKGTTAFRSEAIFKSEVIFRSEAILDRKLFLDLQAVFFRPARRWP